jgi:hypothetical protein
MRALSTVGSDLMSGDPKRARVALNMLRNQPLPVIEKWLSQQPQELVDRLSAATAE